MLAPSHFLPLCVVTSCRSLNGPDPTTDIALTCTWYTVPLSSPLRTVDVSEGASVTAVQLEAVAFLYCRWYFEIGSSLWGALHVTRMVGFPELTPGTADTPDTLAGTCVSTNTKEYIYHIYNIHNLYRYIS